MLVPEELGVAVDSTDRVTLVTVSDVALRVIPVTASDIAWRDGHTEGFSPSIIEYLVKQVIHLALSLTVGALKLNASPAAVCTSNM